MVALSNTHGDVHTVTEHDCCAGCGRPLIRNTPQGVKLSINSIEVADGRAARLTYREFQVLELLFKYFGHTVHRDRIFAAVWSDSETDPKTVDVYASKINKKIRPLGLEVSNVWGVGRKVGFYAAPDVMSVNNSEQAA